MIGTGALLLLAAAAGAPQPATTAEPGSAAYPAREVLQSFAAACSGIENLDVAKASALAAGWEEFDPDPDSQIGRLIQFGKEMVDEMGEAGAPSGEAEKYRTSNLPGASYRQTIAGRELFLVISGVQINEVISRGCRLYDFAALKPIPPDVAESWAERKPDQISTPIKDFIVMRWNPGLKPDHTEMEIAFVGPEVKLPFPVKINGLVLTASDIHIEQGEDSDIGNDEDDNAVPADDTPPPETGNEPQEQNGPDSPDG